MSPLRIAVLGAGPIGIEAALYAAALGHDVVVFEQGSVGSSVAMWSHVTLFSPWRMNITPLGARVLAQTLKEQGRNILDQDRCPTGGEFVAEYLLPLAQSHLLSGRLRLGCRVVAVGRTGLLKGDLIAKAARAESRFRLLVEDRDSAGEHVELADVILDCTGTYLCPNAIGDGGISAPGERWLTTRMIRHLPDVLGRDRARFARRRTLLVGGGLSAATAATAFGQLISEAPGTHVTWAVRTPGQAPYQPLSDDPLPERARLLAAANRVAAERLIEFRPGMLVDSLAAEGHQMRVRLRTQNSQSTKEDLFDEIVGLTGYGPDRTIYEQLQIHECYASFGPMKLAATLVAAGGDCMTQPTPGPETLKNPEPHFFILGAKSYGRSSAFLLQIGHAQVRGAFALLHGDEGLDLYAQR